MTKQMDSQVTRQNDQVDQSSLVGHLQSENEHLRKQVDHLTHVVAMQTQQQGELVKHLESPARASVVGWFRLKLRAWGLTRAGDS